VLIASDSPQLPRAHVDAAFAALDDADAVIGSVLDGGYYLIGVRGPHDLLSGVPMSTSCAANGVRARAAALGLRMADVPPTFDVDVASDLDLLIRALDGDPSLAPATLAALREMVLVPNLISPAIVTPAAGQSATVAAP
jgi:glycosyltransferase A (GT-A) superfamily protein (DUF2064 family)